MQTCIMSSLPRCIFRCSVFRYVTLVSFFSLFFVQTLLFNCNSFTLVANKYLLTYLLPNLLSFTPTYVKYASLHLQQILKVDMKQNFSIFFYLRFYKFGLFCLVWYIFYCDICWASCPKISSRRRSTRDFQLRV